MTKGGGRSKITEIRGQDLKDSVKSKKLILINTHVMH